MPTTAQFVATVRDQLGKPYVYGATGPTSFDCSGLILYALNALSVGDVPRTSEDQYAWKQTAAVKQSQLAPGDLIFTQWPGDDASPGHVAVYTGGGKLIEAPHKGEPVHEVALDSNYLSHVVGFRRITALTGSTTDAPTGAATTPPAGGSGSSDQSSIIDGIVGIGSEFVALSTFVGKLMLPATWVRVGAGVMGLLCVLAGLVFLTREGATRAQ